MDMIIPIDPDIAALCVSSVMCALASNPTVKLQDVKTKKKARLKRKFHPVPVSVYCAMRMPIMAT